MKRDGINEDAAMLRIRAGKPDEFYKAKTEHIIYNSGDKAEFIAEFERKLCEIGG